MFVQLHQTALIDRAGTDDVAVVAIDDGVALRNGLCRIAQPRREGLLDNLFGDVAILDVILYQSIHLALERDYFTLGTQHFER